MRVPGEDAASDATMQRAVCGVACHDEHDAYAVAPPALPSTPLPVPARWSAGRWCRVPGAIVVERGGGGGQREGRGGSPPTVRICAGPAPQLADRPAVWVERPGRVGWGDRDPFVVGVDGEAAGQHGRGA